MVFGLGRGKIELTLEKINYLPGDIIKGKVVLKLKKPIKARELRVEFYGIRETRESAVSIKTVAVGKRTPGKSEERRERTYIHKFKVALDGEKEYLEGEYPFEIKIPKSLSQTTLPEKGVAGAVLKTAGFLSGVHTRTSWYVKAVLNVLGLDMSKTVQINVG